MQHTSTIDIDTEQLDTMQREVLKRMLKKAERGEWKPVPKPDSNAARYRTDPVAFCEERLGLKLTPDQEKICRAVVDHQQVLVKASHGIGKCRSKNSRITLANGAVVSADSLVGKHFALLTFNDDDKIISTPAYAEYNKVESIYRITTEYGRELECNKYHPLFGAIRAAKKSGVPPLVSFPNWIQVKDLTKSHYIAVPTVFPVVPSAARMSQDELKILAYSIGGDSGDITGNSSTNLDSKVNILNHEKYQYLAVRGKNGSSTTGELLLEHDLLRKHSENKRIPEKIFTLCNNDIAIFLSRLYATSSGWADVRKELNPQDMIKSAEISFSSISKGLVQDIQELLLRFGICSSLIAKPEVNAWILNIRSKPDIMKFIQEIRIYGKDSALQNVRAVCSPEGAIVDRHKWRGMHLPEGLRWEKIKSIEYMGEDQTVAIEVPGYHTYLTPQAYEHNSYLASALLLWHYLTFSPSRTVTTAPTIAQVKNIIWSGARTMASELPDFLPSAPKMTNHPDHWAEGMTARDDNSFQGIHSDHMLIIFDEAVGIKKQFWNAAKSMMTGPNNRWLAICNPTDTSSAAYEADRSGNWHIITVSALDHPNIEAYFNGKPSPVPGAVSVEWIYDALKDWANPIDFDQVGAEDIEFPAGSGRWYRPGPTFESRVLGRWPRSSDYSVWSEGLWGEIINANLPETSEYEVQIGCDPAYTNDFTAFHIRRGPISLHHESRQGLDTSAVATRLKQLCDSYGEEYGVNPKKIKVKIDTGGLGIGVWDQRGEYNFISVNSSSKANQPERYPNKRSELWFTTVERAKEGRLDFSRLPPDQIELMRPQFFAPHWGSDAQGRLKVEAKDITRNRVGRSPDDADATNLAYTDNIMDSDFIGAPIILGVTSLSRTKLDALPDEIRNKIMAEQQAKIAKEKTDSDDLSKVWKGQLESSSARGRNPF